MISRRRDGVLLSRVMATQYVLVKRDYFRSLLHSRSGEDRPAQLESKSEEVKATSIPLPTQENLITETASDLVNLLPKTYRNRAKALLKIIFPNLRLSSSNVLTFKWNGQDFENLYDLIFWLYTAGPASSHIQRPTNAFDFIAALLERKVPQRLLSTKEAYVRKILRSQKKMDKTKK